MKSLRLVLLMFIVFAFACSSCNKSDTNPLIISISLKANGTLRSSGAPVAVFYQSSNTLQLSAVFNTTEGLSIMVPNAVVGSFDVATNNLTVTYSPDANFVDTYFGSVGSVNITTLTSTLVAGTFQFTGPNGGNSVGVITEGKFQSTLSIQP